MIEAYETEDLAIRRLQRRINETLAKQGIDRLTQAFLHHELTYLYACQRKVGPAAQSLDIAFHFPRIHCLRRIYWMNRRSFNPEMSFMQSTHTESAKCLAS